MNSHDAQSIQNKTGKTLNANTQFYFSLFAFLESDCDCVRVYACGSETEYEKDLILIWFDSWYAFHLDSCLT